MEGTRMSVGWNDRYEERGAWTCAVCGTSPKSEYERGDWHSCPDCEELHCEGCASTHLYEGVCPLYEAAVADRA